MPVGFGLLIWYKQDGKEDGALGQTTLVQSLSALLPFAASLIILKVSMDFMGRDLNMLFSANPRSRR